MYTLVLFGCGAIPLRESASGYQVALCLLLIPHRFRHRGKLIVTSVNNDVFSDYSVRSYYFYDLYIIHHNSAFRPIYADVLFEALSIVPLPAVNPEDTPKESNVP